MLKEFSVFFGILFCSLFFQNVDASLYNYNVDSFPSSWIDVVDPIVLYNSTSDTQSLYSHSFSSPTHTFTKVFGDGLSSVTITDPLNSFVFQTMNTNRDHISMTWAKSVAPQNCYLEAKAVNILNGTVTTVTDSFLSGIAGVYTLPFNGALWSDDDRLITLFQCQTASASTPTRAKDSTGATIFSYVHGATIPTGIVNNLYIHSVLATDIIYLNGTYDSSSNGLEIFSTSNGNGIGALCDRNDCLLYDGDDSSAKITFGENTLVPDSYTAINPRIPIYRQGYVVGGDTNPVMPSLWTDLHGDILNENPLLFLHHTALGETSPTYLFKLKDGVNNYLAKITTTGLSYTSIDIDISDRALQRYIVDTSSIGASTLATSSTNVVPVYNIVTPTSTITANTAGIFTLLSGYSTSVTGIVSQVNPRFTNDDTLYPWIVTPNSGVYTLTVVFQNMPLDYTVEMKHVASSFNGERYVWDNLSLSADRSTTADLLTGTCVDLFVRDSSVIGASSSGMGTVCASGTMPKELVFTQNLAFTFWSLPWGAAHDYNQYDTTLNTKVRADIAPFSYTVNVYHNNGTIFNSTTYSGITTNATTFDQRTLNVTGVELPSRMEVLDNTGRIIYYATIGFPNYFSGISAWFTTWFTVDGFNLLYMLPIIFAAMFTRSSVGIGTGLTVAFISFLAWSGIIVIDDIVVYALVFIAILGMLAYRQLR